MFAAILTTGPAVQHTFKLEPLPKITTLLLLLRSSSHVPHCGMVHLAGRRPEAVTYGP
jgi:hypothetical protein